MNPIVNRFTLITETTQKLNIRDIIFEPNEEPVIGEPLYLRCRRDNTRINNMWFVSHQYFTFNDQSTSQVFVYLWEAPARAHRKIYQPILFGLA